MKNPHTKNTLLQAATSQPTHQSLQESIFSPIRKKKFPSLYKNKTLPTHNPTDRKIMREIVEKQNGMSLDKKEGQLVTCGIFYCRDSAKMKDCGSLQTSSRLDSDVLRNRQQKYTANPLAAILRPTVLNRKIVYLPTRKFK